MMRTAKNWTKLGAGACLVFAGSLQASAQSSDALLDKLVEKGILTVKEANELKQETVQGFNQAMQAKNGMPDWVSSLKFSGDFRGRVEMFTSDNSAWLERTRYRYRLRLGVTASLWDDFEVGLRLTSADPVGPGGSQGGHPLSNNTTFEWNGSKKFIYLDAAYGKWTPVHNGEWLVSGSLGKLPVNPFELSNMVWDYDYMPEGVALQLAYMPDSRQTLKLNAGAFVMGEINQQTVGGIYSPSHDPFASGVQVLWNSQWTPKFETSLTVAAFGLSGAKNLDNALVPNLNDGNTRDGLGRLKYKFNPIVGGASATYKLESFPLYAGEFPIKVGGEYMDNPAAPSQNKGYRAAITFGKSGRKHTWDLTYRYQRLEADAWYEEVVDEDNGAFYQAGFASSGFNSAANPTGSGWRGGTNVKGHLVTANYSITDFMTLGLIWYVDELVNPNPKGSSSRSSHIMADVMWKF